MVLHVLAAVGIVAGLFLLNVFLYRSNQKTPRPEGCREIVSACSQCAMEKDCALKQKLEER